MRFFCFFGNFLNNTQKSLTIGIIELEAFNKYKQL